MAIENLYTYTETDPNSRIALTQSKATITGMTQDEDAYLYSDKGVDYFAGDFIHKLTFSATIPVQATAFSPWAITNAIDDFVGLFNASANFLALQVDRTFAGNLRINVYEADAGVAYTGTAYVFTSGTTYYLTVLRNEAVGTYGTLYLYIYSDATRTTLLDTLSVALHTSKKDFRYIFAVLSRDDNQPSQTASGTVENLELSNTILPIVTQQPLTAIAPTTATGHGTIVSIGASSVTEHGHCWNTSTAPTTANSKTTNGAGAVGTFTSAITGLTPGTKYYVRAYATNTQGTGYSNELSFTAGNPIQSRAGKLFIKGTDLRYGDNGGLERKITGTLV